MTSEINHTELVIEELYHRSLSDLSQLQRQLPQDAVAQLAREVLVRLQRQAVPLNHHDQSVILLSEALISTDAQAAAALIEHQYRAGMVVESLYLNLLAPAAVMLGEWWEEDKITFGDVTVGTGRIYSIMRSLNRRARPHNAPEAQTAFFASVPGEDHTLGLKMAVDLARKQGWDVKVSLETDHDELVEAITASGQLLVGLSVGGEHALQNLARLILALRVSIPDVKIMISGAGLDTNPDKIALMHPDASARTFEEAMTALDQLWNEFHAP